MLISVFARAAGLSVDTVNFYVRRGLLAPRPAARATAIRIAASATPTW
jgi:DNA-binding transcriptional MerR regulator